MLQLEEQGGKIAAKTLFRLEPSRFGSTQHTPIFFDGHLYGVREKDKQLVCLDLDGNEVWSSGSQHRFGLGPYLIADGLIFVLNDYGRADAGRGVAGRLQATGPGPGARRPRRLGPDGPGRRPADRPRLDADGVSGRVAAGGR